MQPRPAFMVEGVPGKILQNRVVRYVLGTLRPNGKSQHAFPCWVRDSAQPDGGTYDWTAAKETARELAEQYGGFRIYRVGKFANLNDVRRAVGLDDDAPDFMVLDRLRDMDGFQHVTGIFGSIKIGQ